jgi:uncharacterized protein YceK
MVKTVYFLCILMIFIYLAGCSYVLHKREPENKKTHDQGSETIFKLQGPKAVIQYNF